MSSSGLIYDSSFSPSRGSVWLDLPYSENPATEGLHLKRLHLKRSHLFGSGVKLLSNFLVLGSLAGMILTMLPVAAMEAKYQIEKSYQLFVIGQPQTTNNLITNEPITNIVGPANDMEAFAIHINKINAHSVVIPNVDANDPNIYMEALKNGVAHALGSGLPGVESSINRSIYLFAHSTSAPSLVSQYNAQFYLLSKLEVNDEVDVTFWAKNYRYKIVEKKTVAADDTSFLVPQTEKEILILATCTPPGTTWKRLIVVAERTL